MREQKQTRRVEKAEVESKSLIVAEEQRLSVFVGMRYPRLRKVSSRSARVYGGTYNEGVEEGKTITFNDGITEGKNSFGGLLPQR